MKACSSCDSSSDEVVKLSPQAVGLLAVLAVSGSVALLSLGKQKLWHYIFHPITSTPVGDEYVTEEVSSAVEPVPTFPPMCSSPPSASSGKKAQLLPKKVRFAPDVIDPSGDGREYRCQIKVPCQKSGPCKPEHCQSVPDDHTPRFSAPSKASQDGKMHILAKPKLPANRMALYNGMRQYRSVMTFHCDMKD